MINRREFIGIGAAASATVLLPGCTRTSYAPNYPLQDANGHLLWQNWSGTEHAYPVNRAAPATVDELRNLLVAAPAPIRPVGAGHSFTGVCTSEGTLLSLDNLSGLVSHDAKANTATVKAGTRLQQLGQLLADINQDMLNIPDINKQSLAGAISTGTHGTGIQLPAMHGRVESFRILTLAGEEKNCSPTENADLFHAALVGMGSFGIMTEYTLKNWPLQRTERRVDIVPLDELLRDWQSLYLNNRNAEFFYIPFTGIAARILHNQTTDEPTPRGPDKDMDTLMDLKKLRDYLSWSSSMRRRVAEMLAGKHGSERAVDYSWKLMASERSVRFKEMEFHLPLENQLAALKEVIATIESKCPDVFFPIEARVIQRDSNAWLSPFYERDSGSIAVHTYYEDNHQYMFDLIEPIFRKYGGRPHWGKLHSLGAADFEKLYPKWQDVAALRREMDPQGKLLNPFLKKVWGV
ncbi:FAD-linked oxidoreductase [Fluviicoccus keumensis]|uniref:FAD-linked oxidoreductase n=1 Tax=Fluviicoccus keumensis TaxID=1435465 RepID=A0A4Q7YJT9_9GAMM|nr:D-arabinono-1,4-lactone oxidase [Fluviicoccus keumensis]RZU36891.1 FAD-linked oxidoreductase [Fluviicoccus keumensis]